VLWYGIIENIVMSEFVKLLVVPQEKMVEHFGDGSIGGSVALSR